ncbi:MAG TPA: amino acid racemase [Metalysinibacillus jejuensis]|uniref:Amino acid racemase n=1 Tax=Metalysinibacillus jejuensis TaxID=914327 RepID=A0A921NAF2_9BACL|nr:amino acid racemase [Metalysinibacillus jejuensis]HJH10462.1 amino acid racemase [Metalysinibacillus jejuensis]
MKKVGIIGGVGPLATMFLGEMIVRLTDAQTDQQHIHTIINNDTTIPDRTAYVLDNTAPNPIPYLQRAAQVLTVAGADLLLLPCNTAHTFYQAITEAIDIPLVHMINETVAYAQAKQAKRVGILATDGTIAAGVYQQALVAQGMEAIVPPATVQKQVMAMIYHKVKAGQSVTSEEWQPIETAMVALGCDALILGCTELSIINRDLQLGSCYIDSLVVLAQRAIQLSGYQSKKEMY